MLVESMNEKEISAQVFMEYEKLCNTTVQRLLLEYSKERKKLKIDKARIYSREYCVKTAGKNNWIICIGKPPSVPRYLPDNNNYACAVYYYNEIGLRVFQPMVHPDIKRILAVLNGHVFMRYNERLALNISKPVDIVKHYLKYNGYLHTHMVAKEGRIYSVGFCKDGLFLGQFYPDILWLVWNTFVSRDLAKRGQNDMEKELIDMLRGNIEEVVKEETYNENLFRVYADKIAAITGKAID
jgi:hypothetical protein